MRARRDGRWPGLLALLAALAARGAHADGPAIEFNRDVRPILSEHCFACHGPDARKREAGLRLDAEGSATGELPSGNRAVVPGDPDASELVFRVEADDETLTMPPPKFGKPLTPEQAATLRRWVEQGAAWEPHWSLAPIRRPTPPAVDGREAANPIDAFVLDALRRHALEPAPGADRVTLIRRVSRDLTGLPPTPAEVEAFLSDASPDAYERLVDRLLASPRFGERMAVFWLDLVRYADSVGYHGDQPVSVSPFRDYVIDAFNSNKPFDAFTVEQIAGDLLPDPTLEQRVAAGYNRLGMMSAEGGVQPREYLAKYAAERVRNVGGAWLGATLGCCECHDHKYDPFATRDFYRMEAFFADIKERGLYDGSDFGPFLPVPTPSQAALLADLDAKIAEVRGILGRPTPELAAAQAEWEKTAIPPVEWTPLAPFEVKSANGTTLTVLEDGSVLASGESPKTDTYTVVTKAPLDGVSAIRVEALPDPSLPSRGPGRAGNGNFVLSELKLSLQRAEGTTPQPIVLENASASFEQAQFGESLPTKAYAAALAIDGTADGPGGWAVLGDAGRENSAVFEAAIDLDAGPDARLTFDLVQNHEPSAQHTLGRFRLYVTREPRPLKAPGAGLPRDVRDILAVAEPDRDDAQREALAAYYRSISPLLAPERERLAGLEKSRAGAFAGVTTTVATERVEPRPIRVLARGNWMDDSGELVEPGVPAVLPQPEAAGRRLDRLDLARWLVSPENPLTARTLANRLWKLEFGAGLSTKLDDLGSQGDWPSHPELLDYLAGRLIDSGWDMKALLRLIVTSEAYKRSSTPTPDHLAKDPTNRWLARQGRFRMEAELVRDAALAASGLLVERLGGPSVKPYQPPGYWSFLNFPAREWENDTGTRLYRRGLYIHWQRQYLYPSLLAFDAPSREECTAERGRSNTPLQALVLLNDPAYVEAARALAARALREGGPDPEGRLDFLYRAALSRPTRPEERAILADLLARHLDAYRSDPDAAAALLKVGARPVPADRDAAELAAWTDVARAVLNLHAAITRD
jgi:hypothetical protein